MALSNDLIDRLQLEQDGYRSRKILGETAGWLFHDVDNKGSNMDRAIKRGYFVRCDNGRYRVSMYYQLTEKGRTELSKVGKGFTYADLKGKIYNSGYRKIGKILKKQRADLLLALYDNYVTSYLSHEILDLNKTGWYSWNDVSVDNFILRLVSDNYIIRKDVARGEKTDVYFKLNNRGIKLLRKAKVIEAKDEIKIHIESVNLKFKKEQAEIRKEHNRELRALREERRAKFIEIKENYQSTLGIIKSSRDVTQAHKIKRILPN